MKKVLKVIGGLAALLLVLIITLPFFVNVDQFRPEIVKVVNERINGTFELGKLSLSLWGRIHVGIDGLKLADARGKTLVTVKDAAFDLPYASVLSGAPLITFVMKEPEIHLAKDKAGKLNVMDLVPGLSGAPASGKTGARSTDPAALRAIALPAVVLNARFGLSIENARLGYRDEALALTNTIDRLNLRVRDFSLSRKTEAELWAELNTRVGADLAVAGPLRLRLELEPDVSGGSFKGAAVSGDFSADDLQIEKGVLFLKRKGVPAHLRFQAALTTDALSLKESALVFHNAEVALSGNYHLQNGADFRFQSKPVELKLWSELIPMLKEYELEGRITLAGTFQGKPAAPAYSARIGIEGVSAKGPHLKAKPLLQGSVEVVTDRVEKLLLTLTAPGNSLQLESKVVSFTNPRITFAVKSSGMDLDQWIDFPKPGPVAKTASQSAEGTPSSGGKAPGDAKTAGEARSVPPDTDALLAPLRSNPMARALVLEGAVSLAMVKARGFRMEDLSAKVQMKNLVFSVNPVKLRMYDGSVSGSFTTDLKPAQPGYTLSAVVSGFDMQKAVEAQFYSFKNTLTGKLSASLSGSGASFNPDPAKKNLQAKGDFKVMGGAFKSMDIAKMANDAIAGSIGRIGEKVPLLRGRDLKLNPSAGSKYELISGTFTIRNGVLEAPDFAAKAAPKGGIDLKGYTRMGLLDESLEARWELTDTQRVTGADRLSVEIAGRTISNFLAKSEKDPVTIPVTVGCKWSAPCTSYTQVAEHLAGIAAHRLTGAAKDAAQEAVKQKVQEQVKDVLKKNVGDALKGLFGR
jgi:AsmA protein